MFDHDIPNGGRSDLPRQGDPALEELGLTDGSYLPEEDAPRVDHRLLNGLAQRKLCADEAEMACRLVASYRSWAKALSDILLRDFTKSAEKDRNASD
jgi:hypothetical protein